MMPSSAPSPASRTNCTSTLSTVVEPIDRYWISTSVRKIANGSLAPDLDFERRADSLAAAAVRGRGSAEDGGGVGRGHHRADQK